eukprot:NODE_103_length_19640_cov_0.520905.p7 type:complete len:148 gc:universal NODE_103_length_19640_cov_0.520905:7457-7014(-)
MTKNARKAKFYPKVMLDFSQIEESATFLVKNKWRAQELEHSMLNIFIDKSQVANDLQLIELNEIETAAKSLPISKSAGIDKLTIKLIVHADPLVYKWLQHLLNQMQINLEVPDQLLSTIFVPIPKEKEYNKIFEHHGLGMTTHLKKF